MEQKWIGRGFHRLKCKVGSVVVHLTHHTHTTISVCGRRRKNIVIPGSSGQIDGFILEHVQQNVSQCGRL